LQNKFLIMQIIFFFFFFFCLKIATWSFLVKWFFDIFTCYLSLLLLWCYYGVITISVSGENHQPVANHWQTLSHNVVSILFILVTQYSNKISLKICLYNGWYEYANSCKNKNWKMLSFIIVAMVLLWSHNDIILYVNYMNI
jgi:hypothetical protein